MTVNQHIIAAARVSSQHVSSRVGEDQQMDDGEPSDLALPDEFLAPPTPFRTRASLSTAPLAANVSSSRNTSAPLAASVSSSRNTTAPLAANVSSSRNTTAPLAADVSSSRNSAPLAADLSRSRNTAPLAANMSRSQNVSSRRSGATSTDFSGSQRYRYQFTSFLKLKCAMADIPVDSFVRLFGLHVFEGFADGTGFLNRIFLNFVVAFFYLVMFFVVWGGYSF
jgi:hypothetical protein